MASLTLGERIRAARIGKGWKQRELARRVRVQPQAVSNWERNVSVPDLERFEVLADELGLPVSSLLGFDGSVVALLDRQHEEMSRLLREGLGGAEDRLLALLERQSVILEKIEQREGRIEVLLERLVESPTVRKQPRRAG